MKAPFKTSSHGRDFSLAVANRSAALMRLGYHKAALEDVETALSYGYPQELRYKLLSRKLSLMNTLGQTDEALMKEVKNKLDESLNDAKLDEKKKQAVLKNLDVPLERSKIFSEDSPSLKLTKSHPSLSSLTYKASVEYHPTRGRFVTAENYICSGELVLVEDAAVSLSKQSETEMQCDKCLKKILYQLVPCFSCAEVVYCSEECRELAESHKFTCNMPEIFQTRLSNMPPGTNLGELLDISKLALKVEYKDLSQNLRARRIYIFYFSQCLSVLWLTTRPDLLDQMPPQ